MVTRLNGFSNTGIDIDTTVTKLMQAAHIPYDRLAQKKQTLTWQRDDYRAMNAKFFDFRNTISNLKLPSTYGARKASSSDDSAISATATANANPGINTIIVNKLATAATATSNALGASADTTILGTLGLPGATTLTVGGEKGSATIELKTTDTIAGLVAAVNGKSSTTGVKVSYDSNIDRLFFTSSTTGTASKIDLKMQGTDGTGQNLLLAVLKMPSTGPTPSATVNNQGQTIVGSKAFASSSALIDSSATTDQNLKISVTGAVPPTIDYNFTINNKTTIGKLIDNINNSALGKTGVSAYLDSAGKIAFFNPDDTKAISFADTTSDASDELANLGLNGSQVTTSALDYAQVSASGLNSDVVFNGVSTGFATNTFSINGISFNAKKEQPGVSTNITVTQDTDSMYNSLKAFVDKYNDLISTTHDKVNEKLYRDFPPLTDDQRKAMKDTDIVNWEAKAKSGLLHNDSLINSGIQSLRSGLSGSVDGLSAGTAKSLSDIGIGTTIVAGASISGSYLDQGKLYIDETKLRKALDEKPDEVLNLFVAKDGNSTSDSADGIATRMYDRTTAFIDKITKKAGATGSVESNYLIGKSVLDLNTKMSALTTKLDALQTRYYNQFTAMEKYINQMNTQSAQLANFGK